MLENIAKYVDHTLLSADATPDQVDEVCQDAREYDFASVCINPAYVEQAVAALAGSGVQVCTVVGFPLGATTSETKAFEARQAIENGAGELDMVLRIGSLKTGRHDEVRDDIEAIAQICHESGALLKVIIEAAMLTDEEKKAACRLAVQAGADYVKTSTGFGPGGATENDVTLMRSVVGDRVGVKAAGGIKTYEDAVRMIEAGASRIGASAGVAIARGAAGRGWRAPREGREIWDE